MACKTKRRSPQSVEWSEGHPKNAPKKGPELARWLWERPDLTGFPPTPCHGYCYRKNLKRFHLTCLTCPDRRFRNRTWRSRNLKEYKQIIMILESPLGKKFVLPESYMTYGMVIPTNSRGLVHPLKSICIKVLMTLAERIAEF